MRATSKTFDLFGEQRVTIKDNPLLEGICNHILNLVERQPELLDGKVGEIDRKLTVEIWKESGLRDIIPADKWELFVKWAINPKTCTDAETISRARRYLLERDKIRIMASSIREAESHRQRIARSVK